MSEQNAIHEFPRVLLAAPQSGSGKTLITCALLQALKKRQIDVCSFKCGPDYIDPMFHRTVLGIDSENLDSWFSGEQGIRKIFCEAAVSHDFSVMEGVMGLYDGAGGTKPEGSSYHLASITKTPVILIVNVRGMARSMIPLIRGFLDYDNEHLIRGIILNRMTKGFYQTMQPLLLDTLAHYPAVKLLGYFPERKDLHQESRHLGLCLPDEISDIRSQLETAGKLLAESIDLDALIHIARSAPVPEALAETALSAPGEGRSHDGPEFSLLHAYAHPAFPGKSADDAVELPLAAETASLTLAVARDEAFCFYYPANLRMFEELGVHIRYFSPLHDSFVPEEADGILLGGGYPENYAEQLSRNISMLTSIRNAIGKGTPSLAECGGFMYLHTHLTTANGISYPMADVWKADVSWKGKLVRFGYVEIKEKDSNGSEDNGCFIRAKGSCESEDNSSFFHAKGSCEPEDNSCFFIAKDKTIRAHEFHYYDSTDNGSSCTAIKTTGKSWDCIVSGRNFFWGFPHLYYPSCPEFVNNFVKCMRDYHIDKGNE